MSQVFRETNEFRCEEAPKAEKPEFRGWTIERNLKPIPSRQHDFDFWHVNYDGADGGNGLAGTASSREDAIAQIEDIELSM